MCLVDTDILCSSCFGIKNKYQKNPCIKLVFSASVNAFIKITKDRFLLVGQTDTPSSILLNNPDSQSSAIQLPPGAIKKLFNIPACEITNRTLLLSELDGGVDKEKTLQKAVAGLVNDARIDSLIRKIIDNSIFTVRELSAVTGYSNRQLQRIILENIGFTPKTLLSILRFKKSRALVENRTKRFSLSSIAYENGYYDQSHMIKEFLKFSDFSPRGYQTYMSDFSNTSTPFYVKLG
jgi:AraC-like DNA-binding protein